MNILILGNGFIGNRICKYLNSRGHLAVIISKAESNYCSSQSFINDLGHMLRYDFIINTSGYTGYPNIDDCEDNKQTCLYYNAIAPFEIALACKYHGIPMIHISSGCIYNGYRKIFTVDDTPNFGFYNNESSFYSKTKHLAEILLKDMNVYILRIRMPFDDSVHNKNYIYKILKYDNLISLQNSVTCIHSLGRFINCIVSSRYGKVPIGTYNVVNRGYLTSKDVVDALAKYGIVNINHSYISAYELHSKTKALRSNCRLEPTSSSYTYDMPNVQYLLDKNVKEFVKKI